MNINIKLFLLSIITILFFFSCSQETNDKNNESNNVNSVKNITLVNVTQTGGVSCSADTTGLILTFDNDPISLTVDNISVTGATKGTLSGTGTTRSLTISGILVSDSESVSISVTSPVGYSISGTPKSVVVYRAPYVGMIYGGGIIAYILQSGDPGYVSGERHGIIAATADQSTGIGWAKSDYYSTLLGNTSTQFGSGVTNTNNIIIQNGSGTSYAAGLARAYNGGGYNDWYLPSQEELYKLYLNKDIIGGFVTGTLYWSSSEFTDYGATDNAYALSFSSGNTGTHVVKWGSYRVRAVRSF